MGQPPIADFHEDREARLHHRRSGRKAYVVAFPMVAALIAVALLGVAGSRLAPTGKAQASGSPGTALASASASPTGRASWPLASSATPVEVFGLSNLRVNVDQMVGYDMPTDTLPLDADGDKFLYTSGPDLFVLALKQNTFQVASARPCGQIEQAALSGAEVIFSEMVPHGYSGDGSEGCPTYEDAVDWYVHLYDYTTGLGLDIASGTSQVPPGAGPAQAVPSVAITASTYAFSRPDPTGKTAVVEVRTVAGGELAFQSEPVFTPVQVHLGVSRLAVVAPGFASNQDPQSWYSLMVTQDFSGPLQFVGLTSGIVSLSRDGRRVAYAGCVDGAQCLTVKTLEGDAQSSRAISTPATSVSADSAMSSLHATVWITATPDGTPYLGLATTQKLDGMALTGFDTPMWARVQDDMLLVLSTTSSGIVRLTQVHLPEVLRAA
jgi:hypothetical protein